ncbi:MAG: hypothetical protein HQL97_12960 [Magnetococcales bacterium]|nr:hypothetical protein [Magnetococcales bacterium]MBF0262730.1 hypothetical protein [Magnetococcales bacterium]
MNKNLESFLEGIGSIFDLFPHPCLDKENREQSDALPALSGDLPVKRSAPFDSVARQQHQSDQTERMGADRQAFLLEQRLSRHTRNMDDLYKKYLSQATLRSLESFRPMTAAEAAAYNAQAIASDWRHVGDALRRASQQLDQPSHG